MPLFELLGRAWEALTRPIDSFLLGCALALVGVGLVTLFSAAGISTPATSGATARPSSSWFDNPAMQRAVNH